MQKLSVLVIGVLAILFLVGCKNGSALYQSPINIYQNPSQFEALMPQEEDRPVIGIPEIKYKNLQLNPEPDEQGNLVIRTNTLINEKVYNLAGSILIQNDVHLEIRNSEIIFSPSQEGQFGIRAANTDSGQLIIINSIIKSSTEKSIFFFVTNARKVIIDNNYIERVGFTEYGGSESQGLSIINTEKVRVSNNKLVNSGISLIIEAPKETIVENNKFIDPIYGAIQLKKAEEAWIYNNTFNGFHPTLNPRDRETGTNLLLLIESTNTRVMNNTFSMKTIDGNNKAMGFISITQPADNNKIVKNIFMRGKTGVSLERTKGNLIAKNYFYDIGNYEYFPPSVGGIRLFNEAQSENIIVANNFENNKVGFYINGRGSQENPNTVALNNFINNTVNLMLDYNVEEPDFSYNYQGTTSCSEAQKKIQYIYGGNPNLQIISPILLEPYENRINKPATLTCA